MKMIGFEFRIKVVNHINVKWTIVKKKKKKKKGQRPGIKII